MQRMFSLTYSEKPLRLQRMAGAPNILRIQNLPFGDKVYPPRHSMKALCILLKEQSLHFAVRISCTTPIKRYKAIVLTTEAPAPIAPKHLHAVEEGELPCSFGRSVAHVVFTISRFALAKRYHITSITS